tara:strand:+ start:4866 stop:5153 length:288 start_codon:yes stop_codon:yes gene_type:complete
MSLPKATGQEKRKWSKLVLGDKKNLYTSEPKDTDIITAAQHANHFALDTSAVKQNQNLQQDIGHVKLFGQDQEDQLKVHPKIGKENISIFVVCLI